jgi:hypothetical protein
MNLSFDQTDFSVVVKNRAPPPKAWRWEIYRAGRGSPIECSSAYFETVTAANRAGKDALKLLLTEYPEEGGRDLIRQQPGGRSKIPPTLCHSARQDCRDEDS